MERLKWLVRCTIAAAAVTGGAAQVPPNATTNASIELCNTCQSVAHLLVTSRKELSADLGIGGAVDALFAGRAKHVCNKTKLLPYSEPLGHKPETMARLCKGIMPDKYDYKVSQALRKALLEAKPRSVVSELLCVEPQGCTDSAGCETLLTQMGITQRDETTCTNKTIKASRGCDERCQQHLDRTRLWITEQCQKTCGACPQKGRCSKLWSKEEEPWRKKAAGQAPRGEL
mmetsp:Transcript_55052/g.101901  ORF Transcript_55052/g.101901 Transcript_55052/m.101901 type:complete len:230 (-) Transcript_55052:3-692(-)